jgi:hypothetical protein
VVANNKTIEEIQDMEIDHQLKATALTIETEEMIATDTTIPAETKEKPLVVPVSPKTNP